MVFTTHTIDTVPDESKALMEDSQKRFQFVPNLHGVMAESPILFEAYKTVGALFGKAGMSALERQIVLLAINFENQCHYCMAAHSVIAQMEQMPPEILTALRDGAPLADAKLETLRSFAAKLTRSRGWVDESDLKAMHDAGYTNRTIQEIIVAIGFKVMSNYMNHVAETPVDAGFQGQAWTRPDAA